MNHALNERRPITRPFALTTLATLVTLASATLALSGCGKAMLPTPESTTAAATASASMPADGNVVDIEVTTHVQTALLNEASLQGQTITVATLKGDVRLTGVLDTREQVDTALRVARAAEGVHSIHDELTVKP